MMGECELCFPNGLGPGGARRKKASPAKAKGKTVKEKVSASKKTTPAKAKSSRSRSASPKRPGARKCDICKNDNSYKNFLHCKDCVKAVVAMRKLGKYPIDRLQAIAKFTQSKYGNSHVTTYFLDGYVVQVV